MLKIFEDAPSGFVAAVQTAVGTTRYPSQPSISLLGREWAVFFFLFFFFNTTISNTRMNLEKMKFLLEILSTDILNHQNSGGNCCQAPPAVFVGTTDFKALCALITEEKTWDSLGSNYLLFATLS